MHLTFESQFDRSIANLQVKAPLLTMVQQYETKAILVPNLGVHFRYKNIRAVFENCIENYFYSGNFVSKYFFIVAICTRNMQFSRYVVVSCHDMAAFVAYNFQTPFFSLEVVSLLQCLQIKSQTIRIRILLIE